MSRKAIRQNLPIAADEGIKQVSIWKYPEVPEKRPGVDLCTYYGFPELSRQNNLDYQEEEKSPNHTRQNRDQDQYGCELMDDDADSDVVGPIVPDNFQSNLEQAMQDQQKRNKEKSDLINGSYKRPRRQRAAEPLHPADERKMQIEKASQEIQKRESNVRQEMQALAENVKRKKLSSEQTGQQKQL